MVVAGCNAEPLPGGSRCFEGPKVETKEIIKAIEKQTLADEIMMRRLWFPRFIGTLNGSQKWAVYSWSGCKDLKDTSAVWIALDPYEHAYRTPIEAIIETEKWWVANVEGHRGK
jgi:hypothetical protein